MKHLVCIAIAIAMLAMPVGLTAADGIPPLTHTAAAETPVRTQIGISPQLFEVSLDDPLATHAYRLHNLGERDVRARVRAIQWTLDEHGEMVELPTSEESIDRWLVVNPRELDLPAGETRTVRFAFRPALPLPAGEYRAALVFEEVPTSPPAPASGTLSLSTRFRITSAIYASSGPIERGGDIASVSLASDALQILARGEGGGHSRFAAVYEIRREGEPALLASGDVAAVPVLPGMRRPVVTPLPDGVALPAGRYHVNVRGHLGSSLVSWQGELAVDATK